MMKNNISVLLIGLLMFSCVWLEEKLDGEDPELIFYIVPELEVNTGVSLPYLSLYTTPN